RRLRHLGGACTGPRERPREDGRRQCLEVRLAGQLWIDLSEPLGGFEQQWRGVVATGREERELCAPQLGPRDQTQCVIECSCLQLRLGCRERAPRPARLLGCQLRGSLQESGRCGETSSCLRPRCRKLELGSNVLIKRRRRLRTVPCAAIRVDLPIGRFRQREVNLSSLGRLGRSVHGRPYKRMTERNRTVQSQQPFQLGCLHSRLRDSELLRRAPQKRWIAERLCRRQEYQLPCIAWEPHESPREALL